MHGHRTKQDFHYTHIHQNITEASMPQRMYVACHRIKFKPDKIVDVPTLFTLLAQGNYHQDEQSLTTDPCR